MSLSAASLDAAPKLRVQVDQRGDFVLLGNTLAHDCRDDRPSPVVGTVGICGSNTSDIGVDVFWQADSPNDGQARANDSITNDEARSTAMLVLPQGATITHAYLYWAAAVFSNTFDDTATIRGPNGAEQNVTAIESYKATASNQRAYQSVADVTAFVKAQGPGAYRVSGVDAMAIKNATSETAFAGWWMAVFYSLPSDPPRNLALFDGLDPVHRNTIQAANLSGFLVPDAGYDGKLGVVAFEGDSDISGDQLRFGGTVLSDGQNPSNNFFNNTRSYLGTAVSNPGDLPQLTGGAGSMSGIDLDVVDVQSLLSPGQTSVQIQAMSSPDAYFLGGFITSIATVTPDFTTSTKTATDVNGGALLVGDTLKYTITVTNTGNDASVDTVVTDPLPAGVTYVPGTLQIESGPNSGAKTDAAGDDEAEYDPATRTVTFRIGTGANGSQGGKLPKNVTTVLSFEVKVTEAGTISNQATITAAGELGAPVTDTPTDGNGPVEGNPPTETVVSECGTDADCGDGQVCDTSVSPHVCVECYDDSHCSGAAPTCDIGSNTCICVPTNDGIEICDGLDNNCDGSIDEGFDLGAACSNGLGICEAFGILVCNGSGGVECNSVAGEPSQEICGDSLDSDCDGQLDNGCECLADDDCSVGEVCDTGVGASYTCIPGCRGTGGNGCGTGTVCTSTDDTAGTCVQCTSDTHCGSTTSARICDLGSNTCVDGCRGDGFGNGCGNGQVCSSTDDTVGTCVQCTEDSHCGDGESGKVCDTSTNECQDGCRGTDGNGCEAGEVCTSTDDTIGTCVECLADSDCGAIDSGSVCDDSTKTCVAGCRGEGFGNGCFGEDVVCTSTDATIGDCVECVTDSDCGDSTSGKVCDTTNNACVDGCRGTDGNGCEPGEVCTSTDDTIGTCEEQSDGGAGGAGGAGGDDTDAGLGDDAGDGFGADDGDVWAAGNGVLCATQPGSAGQGAGWLIGGAVVALALARRRQR